MDDYLNKPQWTIRQYPRIAIIAPIIIVFFINWLFIVKRSSLAISGLLLLFVLFFIPFIEITTCTIDTYLNNVIIVRQRIWRRRIEEFQLNNIHTVSVQESSAGDDGSPTYRIVFFLRDAKMIPLTEQYDTGKRRKNNLAEKITAYLNVHCGHTVSLALDGIVRITQPVHTANYNWTITNTFSNDSPPITSFEMVLPNPNTGFMLIVPARLSSTTRIPGGFGGKLISKLYRAYFRVMDVPPQDVVSLENCVVMQGTEFGVSNRLAVVTNQPDWGRTWLSGKRAQALEQWQKSNPLGGKIAVVEPHIFVNHKGIKVVFRENYHEPNKIKTIIQFINQLI